MYCSDQRSTDASQSAIDLTELSVNIISYCGCSFKAEASLISLQEAKSTTHYRAGLTSDSFIQLDLVTARHIESVEGTISLAQLFPTSDEAQAIYRYSLPSHVFTHDSSSMSALVPSPKCEHIIGNTCASVMKLTLWLKFSSSSLLLTSYLRMGITGDECTGSLSAGNHCWYAPTTELESLPMAKLLCQQAHSTGHLPEMGQINYLRGGFINDAVGQLDQDEFWVQTSPNVPCAKWYSYNVNVKPTQCQLKHAVICVTPPPHFSPPLPVTSLNVSQEGTSSVVTWKHDGVIDGTASYELHQVVDATLKHPTNLQLTKPAGNERIVYKDGNFHCPPFAPVRLFLDMSGVFDRGTRDVVEKRLEAFKQTYFSTNVTSSQRLQRQPRSSTTPSLGEGSVQIQFSRTLL